MVEILSGTAALRNVGQPVPGQIQAAPRSGDGQPVSAAQSEFYLSPVLRFDSEALRVIFELRDSNSGEVTRQFPAESVVRELQRTASLGVPAPEPTPVSVEQASAGSGDTVAAPAAANDAGQPARTGEDTEVNVLI